MQDQPNQFTLGQKRKFLLNQEFYSTPKAFNSLAPDWDIEWCSKFMPDAYERSLLAIKRFMRRAVYSRKNAQTRLCFFSSWPCFRPRPLFNFQSDAMSMVHFSTAMRYRLFLEKLNIAIVAIVFLDHRERLFFDYFAHFRTDYFGIIHDLPPNFLERWKTMKTDLGKWGGGQIGNSTKIIYPKISKIIEK